MKKYTLFQILVLSIFVILLTFKTQAALNDSVISYYTFDAAYENGATSNDSTGRKHATRENAVSNVTTDCIINECYHFDQDSEVVDAGVFDFDWKNNNWSISAWAAYEGVQAYRGIWSNRVSAPDSNNFMEFGMTGADEHIQYDGKLTAGGFQCDTEFDVVGNNAGIHHYVVRKTDNNFTVFVNGTSLCRNEQATQDVGDFGNHFDIGIWFASNQNWRGSIDEVAVFNKSLTDSEILLLYNNQIAGRQYPALEEQAGAQTTTSMTLATDLINNTNNYDSTTLSFFYNATFSNATTDNAFISFFIDDIHNLTFYTNLSLNNQFNISLLSKENWVNISFNASNNESNNSIGYYYYNVDTILPYLSATECGTFVNDSTQFKDTSLSVCSNFSDSNLFAYNISYFDSNGNLWNNQNYFLDNITSTYIENISTNTLTDLGNYSIFIQVWDSHTKNRINSNDFYFEESRDKLRFNKMQVEADLKTQKGKTLNYLECYFDRCSINLEFMSKKKVHTFNFTSDSNLHFVEDNEYLGNGYLVNFKEQKWIDFNGKDIEDVLLTQRNSQSYEVTVTLKNSDSKVQFESIGDLNYNSRGYKYEVVSEDTGILREINLTIGLIYEVIRMIPIVMLYLGFMFLGYWQIRTGNALYGAILYIITLFIDFYILAYYGNYALGLIDGTYGYYQFGIFMLGLFGVALVFAKVGSIFLIKQTSKRIIV